eukprot:929266-Pelagomonas_calceolata.AAC.2
MSNLNTLKSKEGHLLMYKEASIRGVPTCSLISNLAWMSRSSHVWPPPSCLEENNLNFSRGKLQIDKAEPLEYRVGSAGGRQMEGRMPVSLWKLKRYW